MINGEAVPWFCASIIKWSVGVIVVLCSVIVVLCSLRVVFVLTLSSCFLLLTIFPQQDDPTPDVWLRLQKWCASLPGS